MSAADNEYVVSEYGVGHLVPVYGGGFLYYLPICGAVFRPEDIVSSGCNIHAISAAYAVNMVVTGICVLSVFFDSRALG